MISGNLILEPDVEKVEYILQRPGPEVTVRHAISPKL